MSARTQYPDYIESLRDDGRSIMYVISAEPGYYKFGITTSLLTRMRKHYRDFQFTHIHAIIDCGCDAIMRTVETEFKQECAKRQLLVTRYGKTEVIAVPVIEPFTAWIQGRVGVLSQLEHPPNNRVGAKKDRKYKAQLQSLIALREHDRQEIEILRKKVNALEELLKISRDE